MRLDRNEVRSQVKCEVRLTNDDGTQAGDSSQLSLNRGLANWRVNPRQWNRPLVIRMIGCHFDRKIWKPG